MCSALPVVNLDKQQDGYHHGADRYRRASLRAVSVFHMHPLYVLTQGRICKVESLPLFKARSILGRGIRG